MLKHLLQPTTAGSVERAGVLPRVRRFRVAWALTAASVLVVLVATLSPFRFQIQETLAQSSMLGLLKRFWDGPSSQDDIINNVLLFMPLGFALGMLLGARGRAAFLGIPIVGAVLSLGVELLQLFLSTRTSTKIDVLTNTTGTLLGLMVWRAAAFALHSPRQMRMSLAAYVLLACVAALPLQFATGLSNWSESFPLLVGNEQSGDRPWHGRVQNLTIIDRALSSEAIQAAFQQGEAAGLSAGSVLADYRFEGGDDLRDRAGKLPDLVWEGGAAPAESGAGITFTGAAWLTTSTSATALNRSLARSSQFTLITTVASADPDQRGPARIVSLSQGTLRRNFTLGQDGSDLVFRLRTPGTGENGVYPQFTAPGVFADQRAHHVAVSYDGATVRLYVDGMPHPRTMQLTKELALFVNLVPPELRGSLGPIVLRVGQREAVLYQLLYHMLMAFPAGLLLALATPRARSAQDGLAQARRLVSNTLLAGALAALVPLVFVVVPAVIAGQAPAASDMVINFGLTLVAFGFCSHLPLHRVWPNEGHVTSR